MSSVPTFVFARSNRYAQAYFHVFVLSIILLWLPNKALAYVTPFVAIGWFAVWANSGRTLQRLTVVIVLFLLLTLAYSILYIFTGKHFVFQNAFLFLLTYGSFLFFIAIPPNVPLQEVPFRRYFRVMGIFIVLESLLGIFQVAIFVLKNGGSLDAATGDIAQGTLDPLSFINQAGNFNNQIYTINLLVLLLFYTPYAVTHKKGIWICGIGFVAVLFASVWHVLISFVVAVLVVSLVFTRTLVRLSATRVLIATFLVLVIMATAILQPRNFSLITFYYKKITHFESLKTTVTKESLTELPREYPWVYITGLGPGQFSSRAGLIGTEKYFGDFSNPTDLPLIKPEASEAFKKYVYPKWEQYATNPALYGNSTMSRPFYSILSLLIEFGYIVFIMLIFWLFLAFRRIRLAYNSAIRYQDRLASLASLSCAVLILFVFCISFFENYLEIAHAVFLGLLLFRYFYSVIRKNISIKRHPETV